MSNAMRRGLRCAGIAAAGLLVPAAAAARNGAREWQAGAVDERSKANDQPGEERNQQREAEHARVERNGFEMRETGRHESRQRAHSPECQ